mgnify:CR=1 FL=1
MRGDEVAGSTVIDPYEIVPAASRVRYQIAIEKHHGDFGVAKCLYDLLVHGIFAWSEFQGREEYARYFLGDQVPAEFRGLRCLVFRVSKRPAPKEGMMPVRFLCLGHPAADWLEDFGLSQFRYQETKGKAAGDLWPDITARTGATINNSCQLKFSERSIDRHARRAERFSEIRFARETLASFVLARGDRFLEGLTNLLMLGSYFFFENHFCGHRFCRNRGSNLNIRHGALSDLTIESVSAIARFSRLNWL